MTLRPIKDAINYLKGRGFKVPSSVLILVHRRELKQMGDYSSIRDELWTVIFDAIEGYLSGSGYITGPKARVATAISKAYIDTMDVAYEDGGGSLPIDSDTASWARGELQAQLGYVDSLFETLKALRKEGDYDTTDEAESHADKYSSALDGFYNGVKLLGAGNVMLTWNIGSAEKHCKDCLKLDGQRHKASWWSSRGYTPRRPGSNTECGGYNCDCSLSDDNGEEFTI